MVFGILGDIAEATGKVVGTVTAVPLAAAAIALGLSAEAVNAAIDAGCETIEEIKDFVDNM